MEAPRTVRLIELGEDGAPTYKGLLILEVGTRAVFIVRPNTKMNLVSVLRGSVSAIDPLMGLAHTF